LLSDVVVKSLMCLLCEGTVIILMVLIISENPKAVCVVPQCLDERKFVGLHSLRSHIFSPKIGPFVGEAAFEEVGPAYMGLWCGGVVE
jgi:hypothetical protein